MFSWVAWVVLCQDAQNPKLFLISDLIILAHFKCAAKKMSLERVKSKNLFNFRPQGFVDEDIEAYEREKKALYQDKGLEKLLENASVGDFVEAARRMSAEQYDGHSSFESHVAYVEVMDSVKDAFLRKEYFPFLSLSGQIPNICGVFLTKNLVLFNSW